MNPNNWESRSTTPYFHNASNIVIPLELITEKHRKPVRWEPDSKYQYYIKLILKTLKTMASTN